MILRLIFGLRKQNLNFGPPTSSEIWCRATIGEKRRYTQHAQMVLDNRLVPFHYGCNRKRNCDLAHNDKKTNTNYSKLVRYIPSRCGFLHWFSFVPYPIHLQDSMEFVFVAKGSRYHDSAKYSVARFGGESLRDDNRSLRQHRVASQVHRLHDAKTDAKAWIFPAVVWILHTVIVMYFSASATVFTATVRRKCVLEFLPMILLTSVTIHMLVIVRRHKKEISSLLADLPHNRPISDENLKLFRLIPETSSAMVVTVLVFIFVFCYSIETHLLSVQSAR